MRVPLVAVGSACAVALVGATVWLTVDSSWLYEGGYGIVAVLMVVVLAAAAQPGVNPLARLLRLRPLVGLGLISYGVYLWHWPVGLWVTPDKHRCSTGSRSSSCASAITLAAALAQLRARRTTDPSRSAPARAAPSRRAW